MSSEMDEFLRKQRRGKEDEVAVSELQTRLVQLRNKRAELARERDDHLRQAKRWHRLAVSSCVFAILMFALTVWSWPR